MLAAFGAAVDVAAEILPNDPTLMRKYGRKILVRRNDLTNPDAFGLIQARWEAGVLPEHFGDLTRPLPGPSRPPSATAISTPRYGLLEGAAGASSSR